MTLNLQRRHLACLTAALLCCFAVSLPCAAHVYATKTLHGLVAEADLVLRVRIVSADPGPLSSTEPPGNSRPGVEASVLERMKGKLEGSRVRFAQHGHGVAHFEPGEETLLFLVRIERSRELAAVDRTGAFAWVSLQEHGDEFSLEAGTRGPLLAAVRGYVEAASGSSPEARVAAVRRSTLLLLESGDAKLAASAVRDLAAAKDLPLVTSADVPALVAILGNANVSMGVRVALLTELERRGLVEGTPHWLALLSDSVPARDRITAIRASGISAGEPVRARLVVLLTDSNERVVAAAAVAFGVPGNGGAVAPLADVLASHESSAVRNAAVRGLGAIGSADAHAALARAAESHPDPATQRRATAELRKAAARRTASEHE